MYGAPCLVAESPVHLCSLVSPRHRVDLSISLPPFVVPLYTPDIDAARYHSGDVLT
jgi:hypothetical protein